MFRILLIAIAACTLSASPAFSQMSQNQQKQLQKRESSGESVTQNQRGGLKKDQRSAGKSSAAHITGCATATIATIDKTSAPRHT
jgi:hypothetical protein